MYVITVSERVYNITFPYDLYCLRMAGEWNINPK